MRDSRRGKDHQDHAGGDLYLPQIKIRSPDLPGDHSRIHGSRGGPEVADRVDRPDQDLIALRDLHVDLVEIAEHVIARSGADRPPDGIVT